MALLHHSPSRNLPPGFTFRGAMLTDLPDVIYLLNIRTAANQDAGHFTLGDLRQEWQTPGFNPAMDVRLVFDTHENLVGYIEVWVTENQPILWGCVHPNYEGRGIGTAMLLWGEARVRLAMDDRSLSPWSAPRFNTFPLERAHELCEHLGWRQVPSEQTSAKKVTGALRLPENANRHYDVYEKTIDPLN